MWVFCWGIPVNVVTTKPVNLDRISVTWSCKNSTVLDTTSGTEQLHCSNWGESFSVAIAVSRTNSIARNDTVLPPVCCKKKTFDMPLPKYVRYFLILFLSSRRQTACRLSLKNFVDNFHTSETSHMHHKSIHLKLIVIFYILLSPSLFYHQISPSAPYS